MEHLEVHREEPAARPKDVVDRILVSLYKRAPSLAVSRPDPQAHLQPRVVHQRQLQPIVSGSANSPFGVRQIRQKPGAVPKPASAYPVQKTQHMPDPFTNVMPQSRASRSGESNQLIRFVDS